MNKILAILIASLILGMAIFGMISAEIQTLPSVKQYKCTQLSQLYYNSTFQNISVIQLPDDTYLNIAMQMQNHSGGLYNLTFCNTSQIGEYIVNGYGDKDGIIEGWNYNFQVTASGNDGTNNLVFIIFIIVMVYLINLLGFFGKNETMTILGGMGLMILGLYMIMNGIIVYRDDLTRYFSMLTIAWGFVSTMYAAESLIG